MTGRVGRTSFPSEIVTVVIIVYSEGKTLEKAHKMAYDDIPDGMTNDGRKSALLED